MHINVVGVQVDRVQVVGRRVVRPVRRVEGHDQQPGLGEAVAGIRLKTTRLEDAVLEVMKTHPLPKVQEHMVQKVLIHNRAITVVYDHVAATARSHPEADFRMAALKAFWTGTPRGEGKATTRRFRYVVFRAAVAEISSPPPCSPPPGTARRTGGGTARRAPAAPCR